jgi:hypothetical protein
MRRNGEVENRGPRKRDAGIRDAQTVTRGTVILETVMRVTRGILDRDP